MKNARKQNLVRLAAVIRRKKIKASGLPLLEAQDPPRINMFGCPKHDTVTVARLQGKTPIVIQCPQCGQPALSRYGRVPQDLEPTHEWVQPEPSELEGIPAEVLSHLLDGGLYLRKIVNPAPATT